VDRITPLEVIGREVIPAVADLQGRASLHEDTSEEGP
jgi:hypothetical protein